jgi:hypothetical protein
MAIQMFLKVINPGLIDRVVPPPEIRDFAIAPNEPAPQRRSPDDGSTLLLCPHRDTAFHFYSL